MLCFTGTPRDGHGQHQTSAILGKEAFEAAGDPQAISRAVAYVQPWQAEAPGAPGLRRLRRTRPRNRRAAIPARQARWKPAQFNPILGYSYEEIAVLSRSMHHSQGTGAMRQPGPGANALSNWWPGSPASKDLFDGIDTTWNARCPGGAAVAPILAEAIRTFEPAHPEQTIPLLLKARPADRRHAGSRCAKDETGRTG